MTERILTPEDRLRETSAGAWLPLLEMYPDKEVVLRGAAGEVAMEVCDVIALVHQLASYQAASSESEPTFEWIIERLDGHYWDSLSQHKALILQHVAGALQTPKAPPLFTGEDGRYEGIRTPDKNDRLKQMIEDAPAGSMSNVRPDAGCPTCGARSSATGAQTGPLKLDTDRQVFFYEQDHYYLSNFSAFRVHWRGRTFDTSEQAYHWTRFEAAPGDAGRQTLQTHIRCAMSAHDAFKLAQDFKAEQRSDWDEMKVAVMRDILRKKAAQHPYVLRKLLDTGDRELIENSWRDPYWGWGENRDGLNMLGKTWMEVRAELRAPTDGESQ